MGWTKRQFVEEAYTEIGLASYTFDLSPEMAQRGLRVLDSMMATWNAQNIRIGYLLPNSQGESDLDQDSGVTDQANEAVYLNLAIRLAPGRGKQLSADLRISAKQAYNALLAVAIGYPPERQMYVMPRGAGNKNICRPFMPAPNTDPLQIGGDGLDFIGD